MPKITDDEVKVLRRKWIANKATALELAEEFDISLGHVYSLAANECRKSKHYDPSVRTGTHFTASQLAIMDYLRFDKKLTLREIQSEVETSVSLGYRETSISAIHNNLARYIEDRIFGDR